ncbi:MAG: hypothetical protein WCF47_16070, partial [Pseudolabrys sp.]
GLEHARWCLLWGFVCIREAHGKGAYFVVSAGVLVGPNFKRDVVTYLRFRVTASRRAPRSTCAAVLAALRLFFIAHAWG